MRIDLALLLLGAIQQPPVATVQGRVFDAVLHIPVTAASVAIDGPAARRAALTGNDGKFSFDDLPSGAYNLRVERSGYGSRSLEVRVSEGAIIEVDLGLDLQPLPVAALSVRSAPPFIRDGGGRADPSTAVPKLARTGLVRGGSPVAELGLADLARDVRGQEPGDPSDLLYVRGSSLDLKLVLLDGAPVYTPFHMGGVLDPLEASTLSAARLHVGAAPARLDGGLSYILDLRTRSPEAKMPTITGSADLLSARAMLETPLGNSAGVFASVRGVSDGPSEKLLNQSFGYTYRDGLVRGEWRPDDASYVRITGYANRELVELGEGLHTAGWGSAAASGAYSRSWDFTVIDIGGSVSKADGTIPRKTGLLDDLYSRNMRLRLHADGSRRVGEHVLAFGASMERESLRENPDSMPETAIIATTSAYGEADLRASEELRVRGGLRVDVERGTGIVRASPRLAATWLLGERTSLSFTAGSYHQYVRSRGTQFTLGALRLASARATHFALALDQEVGKETRLELQGFVKQFSNLPTENGELAYASGVDLWAYRDGQALTAWLGYSLSWLWSQRAGEFMSDQFSAHQVVTAGMRGRLFQNLFADLAVTYGSGLPLTGIDIADVSAANAIDVPGLETSSGTRSALTSPSSSLIRVDARIARTWSFDRGKRRIALTPYLKLLNALDRRDALFYYDDDDNPQTSGKPLAALPFMPLVGLEWRF
jgi:hypothetical protein